MLKALQLAGFKSFADKTCFEFPPGITVVVGPNGSGKSNVVDAIKWVLGEQSAKSLRGKDMADVIFKGSGASGRKPMNTAEATIVIDNSERRLPVDAVEVHVTRRVYRSGEGEYLINGQPCRLKDVKDMFRGTGVGTDAYSLIEQGKVDRLLQASPKDRRAIFEEAAGISRFKAKKVEAQRRLERVEQNLLRLSDIVEEVDNRLRNVRNQAVKARRYREYSERLQQLRTQVGLSDWRKWSEKFAAVESQLAEARSEVARLAARAEAEEARQLELETEIVEAGESIRHGENRFARNQEQIASLEAARQHERTRCEELQQTATRHRSQLAALYRRAGGLQQQLEENRRELAEAEQQYDQMATRVADHETRQVELAAHLAARREAGEQRRTQFMDRMRRTASLGNEVENLRQQAQAAEEAAEQARRRLGELENELATSVRQLETLREAEADVLGQMEEHAQQLAAAESELDENQRLIGRRKEELAIQQGRLSGVQERASLLEEWQRNREGLNSGVQQLLAMAAEAEFGPWSEVRGVVADLVNVDVEVAPLLDAALGERSQYVVLRGEQLWNQLQRGQVPVSGRVGLLRADLASDLLPPAPARPPRDFSGEPGVQGRADKLVQSRPEFLSLIRRLLGTTWIVADLATAFRLQKLEPSARFVTAAGELLEAEGTLVIGPPSRSDGLVSRRSELRALRQQLEILRQQIDEAQREILRLDENVDRQASAVRQLSELQQRFMAELAEQRVEVRTLQQQCEQLEKLRAVVAIEARNAAGRVETLNAQQQARQQELADLEAGLQQLKGELEADQNELAELEQQQRLQGEQATAARVELATCEQRLAALRGTSQQLEENRREGERSLQNARAELERCVQRSREAERVILQATSELAELYLRKEILADETAAHVRRRQDLNRGRESLARQLNELRGQIRKLEQQQHRLELEAGQIGHERQTLAARLREDYGIEIGQLDDEGDVSAEQQQQREEVEEEIATLRRRINNIGAVNMEALDELDELETRFGSLSSQYQDLNQAKQALERIIQKINADSRRLFTETLEAIRTNFQQLYRRAFGGGRADIVLEEGVDILECGIEIVATPPGKPSFNNSLLSGGEKALTAVALLMAIFQFRPSPFCVLDEVDAPFDEANIGRFVEVLKDFLGWTRFVIVTHSKKTMTAATTLYGVTMQESGVSKRVSVRFEDVSEDGHISQQALQREDSLDPDPAGSADPSAPADPADPEERTGQDAGEERGAA